MNKFTKLIGISVLSCFAIGCHTGGGIDIQGELLGSSYSLIIKTDPEQGFKQTFDKQGMAIVKDLWSPPAPAESKNDEIDEKAKLDEVTTPVVD